MIRRLIPWIVLALLAAVAFFIGAIFWRAWQLPEDLSASVTETVDAPVEAVWIVLNTPAVLEERFDEVEFENIVEDGRGLASWTARHEDRNYFTRFIRTRSEQPLNGNRWVYAYKITPEEVPALTTRKVEMFDLGDGTTEVKVTDDLVIEDRQLRMWMGVLGIESGAKNEMKALTSLVDAAAKSL